MCVDIPTLPPTNLSPSPLPTQLLEEQKRDMEEDVMCMDIAPVPEGLMRSRFLVVGCADSSVKVLGLDPEDQLRNLALQVRRAGGRG